MKDKNEFNCPSPNPTRPKSRNENLGSSSFRHSLNEHSNNFFNQESNYVGINESEHYNRWLTDKIQAYLKKFEGEIRILIEPFMEFKNMGALFGLYKNYIPTNRINKNFKKIIAKSILDEMRINLKKKLKFGQKNIHIWESHY